MMPRSFIEFFKLQKFLIEFLKYLPILLFIKELLRQQNEQVNVFYEQLRKILIKLL